MELRDILDKHRDYYINNFIEISSSTNDSVTELLVKLNSNETEEIFNLYRFDLAYKENEGDPDLKEINLEGYLNHEELSYSSNEKSLIIAPIVWNGVDIKIDKDFSEENLIIDWATKWLDIEDENPEDENKLQGVIHNVTKPVLEGDSITFSVDFGSSPVDAAMELIISLLNSNEINRIRLSSEWITNE